MRCLSVDRTGPVPIATLTSLEWRVATREHSSADNTYLGKEEASSWEKEFFKILFVQSDRS